MSKLRSLSTSFWSDPYIELLNPEAKLLFAYLITNEKTNMLGIYELSIKRISNETNIEIEKVSNHLKRFESDKKVKYINNYVILVNFLKHQNFNTNMKKSAIDVYNNLPNSLKIKDLTVSKSNPLKSFETLCNHYGMVRKVEVEVEVEVESEYEKDAYSFLFLKDQSKMEIFEMQNKKSFPDFENFKLNFNSKVVEEQLEWNPEILFSRLLRLNGNWDKKPKKSNSNKSTTITSNR